MLSLHRTAIVIGNETVEGRASNGGIAVLAENLEMTPLEYEQHTQSPMTGLLGSYNHIHSGYRGRMSFDIDLTPPKNKGFKPVFHYLLEACGYNHNKPTDSDIQTYSLSNSIETTVTIMVFNDGLLHRFTGSRGNLSFHIKLHETPKMHFEFLGIWNNPLNASVPNAHDFSNFVTPVIVDSQSTSLTANSKKVPARLLNIDTGNNIEFIETLEKQNILLSNRQSSGQLSFSAGSITDFNPTLDIVKNSQIAHILEITYPSLQKVVLKLPHTQWHQHTLTTEENQWFHKVALAISNNNTDDSPITLELT